MEQTLIEALKEVRVEESQSNIINLKLNYILNKRSTQTL